MKKNTDQKQLKKSTIIALLCVLVGLLITIIGGSYAFFVSNITGTKTSTVTSGTFQIVYGTGSSAINLSNAYPMTDAQGKATTAYTFTVKNNGTIAAKYQVAITEDASTTLTRTLLKYTLQRNAEAESTPAFLTNLTLKTGVALAAGATDTYKLKVWLDSTATNAVQGKVWKGKIQITATE